MNAEEVKTIIQENVQDKAWYDMWNTVTVIDNNYVVPRTRHNVWKAFDASDRINLKIRHNILRKLDPT